MDDFIAMAEFSELVGDFLDDLIDVFKFNRPFKITDKTRTCRFGIVACSWHDVHKKIREKMPNKYTPIDIVLEEDGTVVSKEYFETLKENTRLMILDKNEQWRPSY